MSAPNVTLVLMTMLWLILLSVVAPSLGCEISVLIGGCLLLVVISVTGTAQASVKGRHLTPTSIECAQEDSWIQLEMSLSVVGQLCVYTEPAPPLNWCSVASVQSYVCTEYDQVTHCRLVALVYCTLDQLYCLSIPGCILSPIDHCGISLVCLHWTWTHPLVSWLRQCNQLKGVNYIELNYTC